MSGGLFIVAALLFAGLMKIAYRERRHFPPGPTGIPLLGSAHQLPERFQEQKLSEWGKQYGDIVYFKIFRTPAIVLNTIEAARDLLDRRSAKYSDRPRMVLFSEMIGQEASLPSIGYGERLRRHRKWMFDGVGNKDKLRSYRDIQRREARTLSCHLLADPARFFDHMHLYLASIMLEITYGKRVMSLDDELVRVAERGIEGANSAGSPGSMLVDFFPILKYIPTWFPGAGFKRHATVVRRYIEEWKNKPYESVVSALASGSGTPSIFATVLAEYGGAPTYAEAEDIKGLSFSVYGGSFESLQSRGTLLQFLFHMTRNPRVLLKAQEEMDRVVGSGRLPDFSDRNSLPYLDAVLEEVYRWRPSLPMAIPHRVVTDDKYHDYDIPAGSMVIPNIWAMTRDIRYFPEPEEFRPERFLASSAQEGELLLPSSFVFGFGRSRICPGQAFADASIWLAIAYVAALFNIEKAVDEEGHAITPPAEFTSGFTIQPVPFVCKIVPRSDTAATLIAQGD
ncbi:cytochrome P450 [Trametes versicolor FP-101664 SS1]|uniref:cytochrome P450 n=1 Tax=Trametes versicolor (strain FP-101664) TaxID=717944 RepID=UPI0004621CBD|nr:cytochrome P450 [Trametes versicolor FP-101664 SS1]EIW56875.1 cytochrome P450 [Trametes versicolor FP-101664 SS1]